MHRGLNSIGFVVDPGHNTWSANALKHINTSTGQATGNRQISLILHDYFYWMPGDLTPESLLAYTGRIASDKTFLDNLVAANTDRDPDDMKYYFGEFNIGLPPYLQLKKLQNSSVLSLRYPGRMAGRLHREQHAKHVTSPLNGGRPS